MRLILFLALAGATVALFIYPGYLIKMVKKKEAPAPVVEVVAPAPKPTVVDPVPDAPPAPKPPEYPVTMALSSADGKELEAEILGRGPGQLHLRRASDGKSFALELGRLSAESQTEVRKLPENMTDGEVLAAVGPAADTSPAVDAESIEEKIARRERRIEEAKKKLEYPNLTSGQSIMFRRDIETLQAEIEAMRKELSAGSKP